MGIGARQELTACLASVKAARRDGSSSAALCDEMAEDIEAATATMTSSAEWSRKGKLETSNLAQGMHFQRSNVCKSSKMKSAYRGASKAAMVEKMMKRQQQKRASAPQATTSVP